MKSEVDLTGVRLETKRLVLRPLQEGDLKDFNEYCSREGVGEAAGWKHHESLEESEKFLKQFVAEKNVFALVLKENSKVIGSLGLHTSWTEEDEDFKSLRAVEIGYVISMDHWGKGLMPEAVEKVLNYAFDKLDIDIVGIRHFWENDRSRRVIEKCGFKRIKKGVFYTQSLDVEFDDLRYILYRQDYNLRKKR